MSVEVLGGLSSELPEGEIDCQRLVNADIYKIFCVQRGGRAVPVQDLVGDRGRRLVLVRVSPW